MAGRFWEIDFFRGIAVVLMIIFHAVFDISFFGVYAINLAAGFWWAFPRVTASIFIILAGVSLTISYARGCGRLAENELMLKYLGRGAFIFFLGMLITAFTWLFLNPGTIWFGILHFMGVAIILGYLLLRYGNSGLMLVLAAAALLAGAYLSTASFGFPWLLWLGFIPAGIYSLDYFPLFPWFGIFLLGMLIGGRFYPAGNRSFKIIELSQVLPVRVFCLLGSNSLVVYFIHQPLLIAMLYLLAPGAHLF
jgi:uncharacterized membrane protein